MIKQLIINHWKETRRSVIWTKNLAGSILIGFLYLVLVLNLLLIGLSFGQVFATAAPGKNPVTILNGGLLYYLLFDFILRMIFQKNQGIAIKPYLYLPVKRSTQINYLLSLSFLSIFNFLPLFFLVPFTLELVIKAYSVVRGLGWLLCFILLLLVNCFLVVYIKKSSFKNSRAGIIAFIILAAAVVSDIFNLISISKFSTDLFNIFLANPEFVIILAAILFLVYSAAYRLLLNNFYLESFQTEKKAHFKSFKLFDILESYGETGTYISLELKLLLRNKRSRNLLLFSAAMLAIGLAIYPSYTLKLKQHGIRLSSLVMLIYIGIAITGMFLITYGQYILSWESSYFDAIITKRINFYYYLNAKYKLMIVMGCIFFLFGLPYGFFGFDIVKINFAAFLYNLGVNTFVLMFLATYNRKRFDLNMRMMSQQGRGASQYIAGIPTILIPTAIFLPFAILKHPDIALIFLGALGAAGILFQKQLMGIIVRQFYKQKYKMAAGFRQLY